MSIEAYQANQVQEYKAPVMVKPPEPVQEYVAKTLDAPQTPPRTLTPDQAPKEIAAQKSEIPVDTGHPTKPGPAAPHFDLDPFLSGLLHGIVEGLQSGPAIPDNTHNKDRVLTGDSTGGTPATPKPTPVKPIVTPGVPADGKGPTPPPKPEAGKTPAPTPAPKPEPGHKIGHRVKFSSVADPHVTTGNGRKFDNDQAGDFVLAKSKTGNLLVEAHNGKIPGDKGLWQTKGAIKTDGDVVKYDAASNTLNINGKNVPFKPGQRIDLPGGGYVQTSKDTLSNGTPFNRLQVHTKEGDDVYMLRFTRANGGSYLDITGSISGDRDTNDIKGSAGALDGDGKAANDLQTRDGKATQDVTAFLNDWHVKADESIL